MFSLDYRTMQRTLQRMRYTGSVEASIPSGAFAKGRVLLEVQRGVIQSCIVIAKNGQQVHDYKQIAEELARSDLLEWRLTTAPESPADYGQTVRASVSAQESGPRASANSSEPHILSATSYPLRLQCDPAWFATWPLIHRQVYNLSTGQYSEQDIARLLHYSPLDLLTVFNELEGMGALKRHI